MKCGIIQAQQYSKIACSIRTASLVPRPTPFSVESDGWGPGNEASILHLLSKQKLIATLWSIIKEIQNTKT